MRAAICSIFLLAPAAWSQAPGTDLSGWWPDGCWREDGSGHQGPLRARITRLDCGRYRAVFSGRFAAIVPFRYAVVLEAVGERDGKVLLSGSQWLPLFGRFTYSGEASDTELRATFTSRRDSGTFHLRR
jgi:hypothetical protein